MKTQTFRTEARVDTSNPMGSAEILLDTMADLVRQNSKVIEASRKVGFTADPDKDGIGKHFHGAGAIASMSQVFTHSGPHNGPADYFTLALTTKVHFDNSQLPNL